MKYVREALREFTDKELLEQWEVEQGTGTETSTAFMWALADELKRRGYPQEGWE